MHIILLFLFYWIPSKHNIIMGFVYLTDQPLESQHQQEYLDKENNLFLVLTSGQPFLLVMTLVLFGIKKRILVSLCVSLLKTVVLNSKWISTQNVPPLPFMECWFGLNNKNHRLQSEFYSNSEHLPGDVWISWFLLIWLLWVLSWQLWFSFLKFYLIFSIQNHVFFFSYILYFSFPLLFITGN